MSVARSLVLIRHFPFGRLPVGELGHFAGFAQWEPVSRVHGRYLGHVPPANTLVEVSNLVNGYEVEIEAEAVVGAT
jgi:enamine deaminase RidA (YjgF/YER057c/UK114 family)